MSKTISNPMKVITAADTRWSYANVWEPKSINGGTPKYSVSLIVPKSDTKTLAKIKAAIEAAYKEGEAKLKGNGRTVPAISAIKTPLRDGDTERPDDPAYAHAYFVNANATSAPGMKADTLSPEGIDERLTELQQELIKKANRKQDYDAVADEIFRLRDQKEKSEADSNSRKEALNRIKELQDFIATQPTDITEFDEALVRRLIHKITVYEDKFTVEFKSGVTVDVNE